MMPLPPLPMFFITPLPITMHYFTIAFDYQRFSRRCRRYDAAAMIRRRRRFLPLFSLILRRCCHTGFTPRRRVLLIIFDATPLSLLYFTMPMRCRLRAALRLLFEIWR